MATQDIPNPIRNNRFFKYASTKRYLKIFVPGFAFKHDNTFEGKNKFVGREVQIRRLFMWLSSKSRSGSYLITGYRGMGKSLLVKKVLNNIVRPLILWPEFVFEFAVILIFAACALRYCIDVNRYPFPFLTLSVVLFVLSCLCVVFLLINKYWPDIKAQYKKVYRRIKYKQKNDVLKKSLFREEDYIEQKYWRIPIFINLGQEVLNERDVLSLIAQNVKDKYSKFVHSRQIRPLTFYIPLAMICFLACVLTKGLVHKLLVYMKDPYGPLMRQTSGLWYVIKDFLRQSHPLLKDEITILIAIGMAVLLYRLFKWCRSRIAYFSSPYRAIERLSHLCDRIDASVEEGNQVSPTFNDGLLTLTLFNKSKHKVYPIANVREIEQELQDVINLINVKTECLRYFRPQFIIVFDELDKISGPDSDSTPPRREDISQSPEFDTSVEGFTGTMEYEERKKSILHLLSNMKLFIATVQAKCIFISGHELFDASLADLSDREFAISSVFNGVLNVDSFLSPERDQNDVSSMTELYLSTLLLPEYFLAEKSLKNTTENGVPKPELPSLRWYYEYLTQNMLAERKDEGDVSLAEGEQEIQFAVLFLRYFAVYLAHLCNGSPKKISTTLESYIRTESDMGKLYDWGDVISIGKQTEDSTHEQCVLWFDSREQQFVNFIHYIASPVMNSITNEVSHYGDKLLVTSSFILDQIYKYHSKGFSWRNLEQMPELLNASKNPELRDSMASMMEFLLQTHITRISSGIHQYKFHKQIAEEITYMSMISEEAAAVMNFTLNESSTVKRYNMRLLSHYQKLAQTMPDKENYRYVLEFIHENLGDIYSMDEDYYYAILEYYNALRSIQGVKLSSDNLITYLKCCLKIGNAYEYRRTYENAYMIYSQIINNLIHFREVDEKRLGLDYTYTWTDDWRMKQPMLMDHNVRKDQSNYKYYYKEHTKHNQGWSTKSYIAPSAEELELETQYQKNINNGIWGEDGLKNKRAEFSQEVDDIISGMIFNFTPEKSDMVQKLVVFEDINYIYQAIIAKLFLMEKMKVGGISYSALEVAESEFRYLHNATNMNGKYVIAADFFQKVSSVLYYKNGYVIPPFLENGLVEALYFYDCNITDFVEDFCRLECQKNNGAVDAVKLKDDLKYYFGNATIDQLEEFLSKAQEGGTDTVSKYSCFVKNAIKHHSSKDKKNESALFDKIKQKSPHIKNCAERRKVMKYMGYKLPCNACRYIHRSLDIQLQYMFVDDDQQKNPRELRAITLLKLTSRKYVHHLRPSETSLMAHTLEQMGDVLLSCSLTRTEEFESQTLKYNSYFNSYNWDAKPLQDYLSPETVSLLTFLTETTKYEVEREERISQLDDFPFTKLDQAVLYYWCASRFYEMGSLYKEAAYCVERVLKVIHSYLQVLSSSSNTRDIMRDSVDAICGFSNFQGRLKDHDIDGFVLVQNLFKKVVKYVGLKFNNYEMGEIIENKWLFHLERMDDIELMTLSEYSDLKYAFLISADIKLMCLNFQQRFNQLTMQRSVYEEWYREYISNVYGRISSPLVHDKTFREEVQGYYMKALINKRVLLDCLGVDVIAESKKEFSADMPDSGKIDFHVGYYRALAEFVARGGSCKRLDSLLFSASGPKERLQLIEYLIQDSIVCLSSVLAILTPHNHFTSFSDVFMAEVYELLWEWSTYYESTYDIYLYRQYWDLKDKLTMEMIAKMVARNTMEEYDTIERFMRECISRFKSETENKTSGGYQYTRLFMNIRHDIDDATIHHIFTNYSAETAVKYYNIAKDVNNEGVTYRNMIMGMYVLDDDLLNDTCQSNLADERYLIHCGLVDRHRDIMSTMYDKSNIARLSFYENDQSKNMQEVDKRIQNRQLDSIYMNSEY